MDQKSLLNPPSYFAQLNTKLMPPGSFNKEASNLDSSKTQIPIIKSFSVENVKKTQEQKLYLIQPSLPTITKSTSQIQQSYSQKEIQNQNLLAEISFLKNQLLHFQNQNESLKSNLKKEQSKTKSFENDKKMIELLKSEIKDYRKLQDKTEEENYVLKEHNRKLNEKLTNVDSEKILLEDKIKWLNEKCRLSEEKLEIMNKKNLTLENSLKETETRLNQVLNCELTYLTNSLSDTTAKLETTTTELLKVKNDSAEKDKALIKLQSEYDEYKKTSLVRENDGRECLEKEVEELKMKLGVMQELASSQIIASKGEGACTTELLNRWRCKLYEQMVQHKSTQMVLNDLIKKNKVKKCF